VPLETSFYHDGVLESISRYDYVVNGVPRSDIVPFGVTQVIVVRDKQTGEVLVTGEPQVCEVPVASPTPTVPPTIASTVTVPPTATLVALNPIVSTVSVAATNSSWTTVGSFPVGDTLTISASGTAAHYKDGNYGPDGFLTTPTSCGITVGRVAYPCGALLGTFNPGDPGATFLIGSGTSVTVSGMGTLSVLFNDLRGVDADGTSYYADNHGAYSVSATNGVPTLD
jgi:hypothetical protein